MRKGVTAAGIAWVDKNYLDSMKFGDLHYPVSNHAKIPFSPSYCMRVIRTK